MKLLSHYRNGNYNVEIYSDGTKVRYTKDDEFKAQFPENIDLKITNYCDASCAFCHENSTIEGKHGNLNQKFIDTLRSGTELAIGGGNALEHPGLKEFLIKMKEKKIFCNLTVNQIHFIKSFDFIKSLVDEDLIKGLGVSFMRYDEDMIEKIKMFDNAVLHVINGIITQENLTKLSDKGLKVLVLGYKYLRRGEKYYNKGVEIKKNELKESIISFIPKFKVISFDNLALEQLDLRSKISRREWECFYMGDDGSHTMYIDLVEEEFALSSTSLNRNKIKGSIDEMFAEVNNKVV